MMARDANNKKNISHIHKTTHKTDNKETCAADDDDDDDDDDEGP